MTALRLKTAAVVYGAIAGLAVLIGFVRGNPNIYDHPDGVLSHLSFGVSVLVGCTTGVVFGLMVAVATRYSVYRFSWARILHLEFRSLFGPLTALDIFGYAAISAVAEELLFRGALQPILGVVATSILFGALHFVPGKRFLPWPMQALVMGFALGGLFWVTGNLLAPIAAHLTINYQNLHFINRYNPEPELPRSLIQSTLKKN